MKMCKHSTIMIAYRVRMLKGSGLSQQAVATKLGIDQATVSRLLNKGVSKRQTDKADRMAYFGLLSNDGNTRAIVNSKWGEPKAHCEDEVHSRRLAPDDPLAVLLAADRFGEWHKAYAGTPPRIDRPIHEHVITHDDTWAEYVAAAGGEAPALRGNAETGGKLAAEGAYVSSYAVRDTRYEYGYPYRNTMQERLLVAALSVRRRRARARDGRNYLASLD